LARTSTTACVDVLTLEATEGFDTTGATMAGYFELYQDKAGKFRFRLKAGNHEIVATSSESYPDKRSAEKGIEAVKNAATGATTKSV
jgi:uncharacterized protein